MNGHHFFVHAFMDWNFDGESAIQLALSFLIGSILGLEREYRSKAAGLRTMIIICLGSTIFTQVSLAIGGASPDRIASTVVTGIGFLGAGVIFKDNLTINGITTATTIWISAALGMAAGAGEYFISIAGTVASLIVLITFENFKKVVARMHQARTYRITSDNNDEACTVIESEIHKLHLGSEKTRDFHDEKHRILYYEVFGKEKALNQFNEFLRKQNLIKAYEY